MIRRATEADLLKLVEAENITFPDDPWKEANYAYELRSNPYASLYVEEENRVIRGYLDLWITFDQAQIANIGVVPEYRRKHIGYSLMMHAMDQAEASGCENITLEVRITNAAAIALYERFGFVKAGRRHQYYEDGEDAWLMIKPLGGKIHDNDYGY